MLINEKEFDELVKLSNLEFSNKEREEMIFELDKTIKFVEKIKSFDVENEVIKKSVKVADLREDVVMPSLEVYKILSNAPEKENSSFSVPKVVD